MFKRLTFFTSTLKLSLYRYRYIFLKVHDHCWPSCLLQWPDLYNTPHFTSPVLHTFLQCTSLHLFLVSMLIPMCLSPVTPWLKKKKKFRHLINTFIAWDKKNYQIGQHLLTITFQAKKKKKNMLGFKIVEIYNRCTVYYTVIKYKCIAYL